MVSSVIKPTALITRLVARAVGKYQNQIKKANIEDSEEDAWISLLASFTTMPLYWEYEHISYSIPSLYLIEDDLFIDLDSQIAKGYYGAKPRPLYR